MCPDYDSSECIKLIEKYVKELHLDAYIINDFTLYISWENISENISKK
jgi:hypothetical protein